MVGWLAGWRSLINESARWKIYIDAGKWEVLGGPFDTIRGVID